VRANTINELYSGAALHVRYNIHDKYVVYFLSCISKGDSVVMDDPVSKAKNKPGGVGGSLLNNYAHVLICLYRHPDMRLREVASTVGITERAVQRIIAELEEEGFLTRQRDGRRNHYVIYLDRMLGHRIEMGITVGKLIALFMLGGGPGEGIL
jgi:hypothetical protein